MIDEAKSAVDNGVEIDSEEELQRYLGTPLENDTSKKEGEEEEKQKDDDSEKEVDLDNLIKPGEEKPGDDKDDPAKDSSTEKEYNNMIEFINDKYDLKLNIDQLPADLSREQEAEIVATLYDRVVQSANERISEYAEVAQLLQDKEVANFIEAKRSGKTLKDFVSDFAGSVSGKSDEEVVKDSLKKQFPNMTDEDIDDTISALKDRKRLEVMASQAREKAIKDEELKVEEDKRQQKLQQEQEELQRLEDIRAYKEYVGKINKVYGVPLDPTMKQQVIIASTQTDEKGMTYLDKALQSDQGVFLATLGLLHMEKLIAANQTTHKNRVRNDLMERLIADPQELQSSSALEKREGFDAKTANLF